MSADIIKTIGRAPLWTIALAVALAMAAPGVATAFGDTKKCAIAMAVDADGPITCDYGLSPEQPQEVAGVVMKGATDPLVDRIAGIGRSAEAHKQVAALYLRGSQLLTD